MGVLFHCSSLYDAITQVSSISDHPERVVIAYRHERCVSDVIDGPSIIELGIASRAQARVNLTSGPRDVTASKQKLRTIGTPNPVNDTLMGRHGLRNSSRMLLRILQWALSTAIVLIHSKNVIGVMIRMALGISF
jgi:hypothetical protein